MAGCPPQPLKSRRPTAWPSLTKIDAITLVYDALGRMAEQNNNGVYTQIVYGPTGAKFALMNVATLKSAFVPLPGGGTAVYNSSGLAYYRHADWLGSSRLATHTTQSSQASFYYDGAYAPYGENYAGSGTTDLNFTGQNQDTAVGLFDFMYREYNSPQGRWAGPDPAGLGAVSMANPQSWNRYAYVGNNPLNAVDPLGLHDPNELATYNDNFGDPNATTYYLDGMQVSAVVAQNRLGIGGGGYNSFTGSSFFFNAQSAMNASKWSVAGGNTLATVYYPVYGLSECAGNCVVSLVPVVVNLGSMGSGGGDFVGAANNGTQQFQQPPKPPQPPFRLASHSDPPLTPGEMRYLGCVARGVALGALGGTAKAAATWFFGPPGWGVNILGGAAAGGAVGAVVCAGY